MLAEEIDATETTAAELLAAYREAIASVVAEGDRSAIAAAVDVDEDRLATVAAGEEADPPLTLTEAAAVLSTAEHHPDAEAITLEVRDALLLEMSTNVLDVEAVAAALGRELDATTVHQKIEGRQPMTLAEYAEIRHAIAAGGP